ncbi:MAG TPA: DnaA/Hda family protein [Lacipirellulaceae bacterium]|nr:DnaA/Hda family protein [Lacipirellulaceae bacterium]
MIDQLSEIPLLGRVLAPLYASNESSSPRRASLGFVAGAENRLVAAALNQWMQLAADGNEATSIRPIAPKLLVLFGPNGTGKTHLALGLVRYWNDRHRNETATYLTAADFYRQYIDAIKQNAVADFRRAIRAYDLLAVDDLHELPSKEHISQEIRFTLDAYEESGGRLIVTSRRAATMLANITPDVRSRLASGLVLQLAPPGNAARVRIIRRASESMGHALPDEATDALARNVTGTANDLFGAVFAYCAASTDRTHGDASAAGLWLAGRTAQQLKLRDILAAVARYFGLPQAQLKSHSRRQSIVVARSIAVYLARELAGASYEQIGRALGGRDHTTIIHNYRKVERARANDPTVQEALDELRYTLRRR